MADPRRLIHTTYQEKCITPGDINEHLPTLQGLAAQCTCIAELGVRSVVSTWALLDGLCSSTVSTLPKRMLCMDIESIPAMADVAQLATQCDVQLEFLQGDSASTPLPFDVDLLFIDTWHVYGHLKRELALHSPKVRQFIAMHDTTIDWEVGESIRMEYDIPAQIKQFGYTEAEIRTGLGPALEEFLHEHEDTWRIARKDENNNGLTVLQRVDA